LTAHEGDTSAYTWRLQHFTLGEHVLKPPTKRRKLGGKPGGKLVKDPPAPTPVTSVGISGCGNFGFVGSEGGRVDRYNLQSGLHRGEYSR
jgi:U3 small nucleolar RNA-associated protein 21